MLYNQALDLYNTIFRMLQFLNRFENGTEIEIERIRIWDFYLLFPIKIHNIRLLKNETEIRNFRKSLIKKICNPYENITEERKIFEKLKPYQLLAINTLASYGIIDKSFINQNRILIKNKNVLNDFISRANELTPDEKNVITLMTSQFYNLSLFGKDGLKGRTTLVESKYDA